MITPVVQRWRDQRGSYRPAGEVIDTRAFEVAAMPRDTEAKNFIAQHHYLGTYPAARERFGLYTSARWSTPSGVVIPAGWLVGVCVFAQPVNNAALSCLPGEALESVELARVVLLDCVPANAESFFLARGFELLRSDGYVGVVSFSDPMPREDARGKVTHVGHVGTIYQATNGVYLGRGTKRTLRLLPDGRTFSARAEQKIRKQEQGWEYSVRQLVDAGATPPRPGADTRAWLSTWLPRVTRKVRHPGNHKYAWTLRKRDRRHLPASLPYPKLGLAISPASV